MDLELDLEGVAENKRLSFCKFVIATLTELVKTCYDIDKVVFLEKYINDVVVQPQNKNQKSYVSILHVYMTALDTLEITPSNGSIFLIHINKNNLLPDTHNKIIDLVQLLEYGALGIPKYGLLSDKLDFIAKNIKTIYSRFILGGN